MISAPSKQVARIGDVEPHQPEHVITVTFGNDVPPIDQSFARMLISGQSLKGRLPCLSHSIATISPAHASMAAQDGRSGRKV
jgi:hypothetical protein